MLYCMCSSMYSDGMGWRSITMMTFFFHSTCSNRFASVAKRWDSRNRNRNDLDRIDSKNSQSVITCIYCRF